ncbi:MAG TPA: nuclear transport factor 2 family protein [Acidimicrobiales bacterium]|nr:nuclear transport factor 2 family protein [Acidimicrobiales bacterium]
MGQSDGGDLAKVAATLEIRNLVARVAQVADHGDLEEYAALYTDDAAWEMPGAPRYGVADIMDGARQRRSEGVTGPGSATRHVITTLSVEVADPTEGTGTATADSYFLFFRDTTTTPTLFNMGHYHDTIRHAGGRWRIARRQITLG